MRYLLAALLVVTTGLVVGIDVLPGVSPAPAVLAGQSEFVLQLDWLEGLIERLDRILEAVVDLLNTVQQLFGGEGGGD